MDAIPDFEDLLSLLGKHDVRYLVMGGLAFIYHARPRYTKDLVRGSVRPLQTSAVQM